MDVKKLSLWGYPIVIWAKTNEPLVVFDKLEDEACFYYVLNGHSNLYMPVKTIDITEHQGVSLQCGHYIGKFVPNNNKVLAEILIVKFPKSILKRIYVRDLPSLFEKISVQKDKQAFKVDHSRLFLDYINSLLFYLNNPTMVIEELLILKIRELFILLANTDESSTIQKLIENLFCDVDFDFRQTIEHNSYSKLKVEELAHICMMSLSTFKRKFKDEFGSTPHKYLLGKKLKKSLDLIKTTALPLTQIADNCGFKEYSNFSATFKKAFNQSPSNLRRPQ